MIALIGALLCLAVLPFLVWKLQRNAYEWGILRGYCYAMDRNEPTWWDAGEYLRKNNMLREQHGLPRYPEISNPGRM